jgi:ABC-type lipoprotein export system ATPase subunit
MKFKHEVQTEISTSIRARQVSMMFDVPVEKRATLSWEIDLPIEKEKWNVGLIFGPSGSGKSIIGRRIFGNTIDKRLIWKEKSVIDDFSKTKSLEEVSKICGAVGFNTIPAWLRPYKVLSTGERFRVSVARRLLEQKDPIVIDEFTSVVDRQTAQFGSYAIQKYVRRNKRKFVAITCHSDIIDWLQPDWMLKMPAGKFTRRRLRQRPKINITIARVPYSFWRLFAPYHYLTANLNKQVKCFALFVDEKPVTFLAVRHVAISRGRKKGRTLIGGSRIVTLPEYQGVGFASILSEFIASCYRAIGFNYHCYPAHKKYIETKDKSKFWALRKRPKDNFSQKNIKRKKKAPGGTLNPGGRPCATFRYVGPIANIDIAKKILYEKNLSLPKKT